MLRFTNEDRMDSINSAKDRLAKATKTICMEEGLSDLETLALLSFVVGTCVACQDPDKLSSEMAMHMIEENIMIGNASAISVMEKERGGLN